jgi:hypothetical protein
MLLEMLLVCIYSGEAYLAAALTNNCIRTVQLPHDVATYVTPLEHSNAYKDIKISGNQIEEGSTNTVRTDNMMLFLPGIVKRKL